MTKIKDLLSLDNFSPEEIDISDLDKISAMLPANGVMDINIAEQGLILTLEGQNLCQEKIALLDRYIGLMDTKKNKAWSDAALDKAKNAGHKTAKDKEWFAQSDEEYINFCNILTMAKATRKWFENKAGYYLGWHYTFKTFLRRDYPIEKSSNLTFGAFEFSEDFNRSKLNEVQLEVNSDDIEWE